MGTRNRQGRKLKMRRETLRRLDASQLAQVAGGTDTIVSVAPTFDCDPDLLYRKRTGGTYTCYCKF